MAAMSGLGIIEKELDVMIEEVISQAAQIQEQEKEVLQVRALGDNLHLTLLEKWLASDKERLEFLTMQRDKLQFGLMNCRMAEQAWKDYLVHRTETCERLLSNRSQPGHIVVIPTSLEDARNVSHNDNTLTTPLLSSSNVVE